MEDGLTNWIVDREDLSEQIVKVSGKTGTAYNSNIGIITPNVNLNSLGIMVDSHILEISAPSPNAGTYFLDKFDAGIGAITIASGVSEPLNTEAFTFKLSNIIYATLNAQITQEDCSTLVDSSNVLSNYSIKTNWDVEKTPDYSGGAWKVNFPSISKTVNIDKIEENKLYFPCDEEIAAGSYSYIILDDSDNVILTSTTGTVSLIHRGVVKVVDPEGVDISEVVQHKDYLLYDGEEYSVTELRGDGQVVVANYSDGDAAGVSIEFLRRLVEQETGYFSYQGLKLLTPANHEVEFGIQNGEGTPITDPDYLLDNSNFKENYLIQIGNNYYKIQEINGTEITLSGLPQDWGTLVAGGTSVEYAVHQFQNDTVEAQFVVFDQLDRRGKDPVIREVESTITKDVAIVALSMPEGGGTGVEEVTQQDESISFEIEYINGEREQGDL